MASPRRSSTRCRPSPAPRASRRSPISRDPDGPLVAEVVKTTSDPYVGRISLVRVFSGTLRPDSRRARLRPRDVRPRARGPRRRREDRRTLEPVRARTSERSGQAIAGDIVAVAKLSRAETGDTLSDKDDPRLVEPWLMPDPLLPGRHRGPQQGRRRQAVPGPRPVGRRGPDDAPGEQPRDASARPLVHGRGARRRPPRPAEDPLRHRRGLGVAAGVAARDLRGPGYWARSPRQAVRGPRAVRGV